MSTLAPLLDSPPLRRQSPPQLVRGADPGANTNFQAKVDDGLLWRLVSVYVLLTPDANAANREVTIDYQTPEGGVYSRDGAAVTVPASDATAFHFSAFRDEDKWEVNSTVLTTLTPLLLPMGHSFNIVTVNKQAGDTLTLIRYVVEKFYPDSADDYPAFA